MDNMIGPDGYGGLAQKIGRSLAPGFFMLNPNGSGGSGGNTRDDDAVVAAHVEIKKKYFRPGTEKTKRLGKNPLRYLDPFYLGRLLAEGKVGNEEPPKNP